MVAVLHGRWLVMDYKKVIQEIDKVRKPFLFYILEEAKKQNLKWKMIGNYYGFAQRSDKLSTNNVDQSVQISQDYEEIRIEFNNGTWILWTGCNGDHTIDALSDYHRVLEPWLDPLSDQLELLEEHL